MAVFPTEYQFLGNDDFVGYNLTTTEDVGLGMVTCVQVRPQGTVEDHFKVCVFGPCISFVIPASRFIDWPEATGVNLKYQATAEDLCPNMDATTSCWLDVADLIREGALALVDADQKEIEATAFREKLQGTSAEKHNPGIAFRWAVAVNAGQKMELHIQAMPCTVSRLHKLQLVGDNITTVLIGTFPLNADLFDGVTHAGPVPVFFTSDTNAARASLAANPATTHAEIKKVNSRYTPYLQYIRIELFKHTSTYQ